MINKLQFYTYTHKEGGGLGSCLAHSHASQASYNLKELYRTQSNGSSRSSCTATADATLVCITVLQNGGRTQPQHTREHGTVWLYIQYLHILIKFHNLICIYCILICWYQVFTVTLK